MSFSLEQVFIVEHYFASHSYACVTDEFHPEYLDSAVHNNSTITRINNRFRDCGSVSDRKRSGRLAILTEAKLDDTEKMLQRSPSKSLRRLSAQSGISYGSAQKTMKMLHLHAYHARCVQELKDLDKERRLLYCRWFQTSVGNHGIEESDRGFFTDEAWFHLSSYVNSQNNRIWSSENPHVLHENCSVVWCITLSNSGPNFL
ncbi:hypothetical protein B7P43_G18291 [Cryptotermes secundus]|uniref:DUF4817 domain-containing protein n=1 Tax=Cryptotermes secundus TaxID=105785 RepID=A0A2J7RS36_9NEOP|nr:hypothetical protein B7P43_G18291 [Cryptotermes secundus]